MTRHGKLFVSFHFLSKLLTLTSTLYIYSRRASIQETPLPHLTPISVGPYPTTCLDPVLLTTSFVDVICRAA